MPIEMPRGLPFSVDTWTSNSRKKRHHFLTHAHKDHSQGILAHASYPIYATQLTKTFVLQYYPQVPNQFHIIIIIIIIHISGKVISLFDFMVFDFSWQLDSNLFVGIEIGQSLVIDDLEGEFLVTAFDANHCPGKLAIVF